MCVCGGGGGGGKGEKVMSHYRDTSGMFIPETEITHTCSNTIGKSPDKHSSLINTQSIHQ